MRMAIAADEPADCPLTDRELRILRLTAAGNIHGEIARILDGDGKPMLRIARFVAEHNLRRDVAAILSKLGVDDRTQAVVLAIRRGWIELPDGEQ